jgi:hypothetical protein
MPFVFDLSNVKQSLESLYGYVAEIADENAWRRPPKLQDPQVGPWIKFAHPNAKPDDFESNSEPFSNIHIHMRMPYSPFLEVGISYNSKGAADRFCDMLHDRNKNVRDKFFAMVHELNDFTFKVLQKTSFKNQSTAKTQKIYSDMAVSVSLEETVNAINKIKELCDNAEPTEDGKKVQYRGPCITICRDIPIGELALENSQFDTAIKSLHEFMLSEPTILSAKDVERSEKKLNKFLGDGRTYKTIVSNKQGTQFFCRLNCDEFEKCSEDANVPLWETETFKPAKYKRGYLIMVKEL